MSAPEGTHSIFMVNTSLVLTPERGTRVYFPFATAQAASVAELQTILDAGRSVFGWRLFLESEGYTRVVKKMTATLLTLHGVALVSDWDDRYEIVWPEDGA